MIFLCNDGALTKLSQGNNPRVTHRAKFSLIYESRKIVDNLFVSILQFGIQWHKQYRPLLGPLKNFIFFPLKLI